MALPADHEPREGLALVEFVVRRHFGRLDSVPKDDLIGYGSLGLVKAMRDYDPEKGTAFGSYAYHRIRGAIADGLRSEDLLGRRDRRMVNAANQAWSRLAQDLGREPTFAEVADTLGADRGSLDRAYKAESTFSIDHERLNEDEPGEPVTIRTTLLDPGPTPEEQAIREEAADELTRHVAALPSRERVAVSLAADGASGPEIGQVLDITASRVSQLRKKAIGRLRDSFDEER